VSVALLKARNNLFVLGNLSDYSNSSEGGSNILPQLVDNSEFGALNGEVFENVGRSHDWLKVHPHCLHFGRILNHFAGVTQPALGLLDLFLEGLCID
jgi:hypothetical protein